MNTDRSVQHRVQEELLWEPSIDAAGIGVAARDGIVTLSGHVTTYGEKIRAERAATRVAGVRAVANEITVHLDTLLRRTDAEIAASAVRALEGHVSVPRDAVHVVVSGGVVTLSGEVRWDFQRSAAVRAVRDLPGVRDVQSRLTITPGPRIKDVRSRIHAAFHRSAQLDADRVSVEVDGDTLTLRGTVTSWAERREAEAAAWAAPGVARVVNEVEVAPREVALL